MIRTIGFRPAAALPLILLLLGATRDSRGHENCVQNQATHLIRPVNTRTNPHRRPRVLRITKGRSTQTWVLDSETDRATIIRERCGIQLVGNTAYTGRHTDLLCRKDGRVFSRMLPPELVLAFGIRPEISRTNTAFWTLVPGIGSVLANRIHMSLHDSTLEIHRDGLCDLEKIRGIGPRLASRIREFMGLAGPCVMSARPGRL